MKLKTTTNIEQVKKFLEKAEKHNLFAQRIAMNRVAQNVQKALRDEIEKVFDNPTKLTRDSVFILYAGKLINQSNGYRRQEAQVYIRDQAKQGIPPAKYLRANIEGGPRKEKNYEIALLSKGQLPSGSSILVPTHSTPTDSHGNVKRGTINQMFDNKKDFFIGQPRGHKSSGVYLRDKKCHTLTALLLHKDTQQGYKKRFKFFEISEEIVKTTYKKLFIKCLNHAIATAR